ncbi:MAG: FAD:protein FMN transferase [Granulosicoccus sp.]
MDRRTYLKTSLALGGSLLVPAGALSLAGCSGTARVPELAGFDGSIMGTTYSVRLGLSGAVPSGLAERTHAALNAVDQQMSTWKTSSDVSRLNASDNTDWQQMSAQTVAVIAKAVSTSAASEAAFDVTVGPLIDLWGFGAGSSRAQAGKPGVKPDQSAIAAHLANVGSESIAVDLANSTVRKLKVNTEIDLSGIAKGHAVDQVAAVLDTQGVESYLIEVGGELRSKGAKPDGSSWKVAIERPLAGQRDVFRVVSLQGKAIATSGDYRNFFDDGGQRYSHSIDPRTGMPVSHELASVSVVADSTMQADAFSTAMMVMGPDEAMDFAETQKLAAHFILKSGSALKEEYSRSFESLLA